MAKLKIFCKECNNQTNYVIDNFCRYHLSPCHGMNTKEYYDKHIKKDNEGKCLGCGKETSFKSFNRGYAEFCSISCLNNSEEMSKKVSESKKGSDYDAINEKIKHTMLERHGVEHALQSDSIKNKMQEKNMENYGTKHTINLPQVRSSARNAINENFDKVNEKRSKSIKLSSIEANEKRKETVCNKYGVINVMQLIDVKLKTREILRKRYGYRSESELSQFEKYRNKVRYETSKNVEKLFDGSDGLCFYTKLKMDMNSIDASNRFGVTIDHKTSLIYGFRNNIDPKIIGGYENLCLACRFVNCSKNYKCEQKFKESKKFKLLMERIHANASPI